MQNQTLFCQVFEKILLQIFFLLAPRVAKGFDEIKK